MRHASALHTATLGGVTMSIVRSVNLGTDQRTGTGARGATDKRARATANRTADRRTAQRAAHGTLLGVRAPRNGQPHHRNQDNK